HRLLSASSASKTPRKPIEIFLASAVSFLQLADDAIVLSVPSEIRFKYAYPRQQIRVSDALLSVASSALYVAKSESGLRYWHSSRVHYRMTCAFRCSDIFSLMCLKACEVFHNTCLY
ncbi:unnamed protein product, partial [Musa hybrid cultivar]